MQLKAAYTHLESFGNGILRPVGAAVQCIQLACRERERERERARERERGR